MKAKIGLLLTLLAMVLVVACYEKPEPLQPDTKWELVSDHGTNLYRIPVEGGWIYRCEVVEGVGIAFVPTPRAEAE